MLRNLLLGAIIACMFIGFAQAGEVEPPAGVNAYGYTFDDVAVNQGVVLYWYAHGYANCYGGFPESFAAMVEKGMPLRTFVSPHTGDAIDPDDGSLDFDGDMMYAPGDCWDVEVHVQTSAGVVKLPKVLSANTEHVLMQFDPCCAPCYLCGDCCDITICCWDCWKIDPCDPNDAICKVVQWMMWKSFELHECLFDTRPVSEVAWIASGLAPVDQNYKEYVPTMDIEYIYKGDCCCQILKKAYVHCCTPCKPCCEPCKPKCDPCKPKCEPCKPKCDPCCEPKCKQNTCTKECKPKCEPCKPKCDPCKPKCEPCKPKCEPCKPKCDPCKPKCEPCKPKCDPCKPKCDPCKPKCEDKCAPKCEPCVKCKQNTCTKPDCNKC